MAVKRYSKLKMFALYVASVLVNILPLIIVLAFNWKHFTKTPRETLAISITGFVWIAFLVVSMIGSLPNKLNRVAKITIVYVMLVVMKPLLMHMTVFAGASAIGALLDLIILKPIITRYKELRLATKTADITTQQMEQVMNKILDERSGRV